ncbi:hypothetical protein [Halorussus halophilus]|uniref:hypothetical protein n=1 Tax=Halorussus halophilus TaxID=2650975 RepID=UPI001300F80B|nr:hypothetical protein [Halorussus halophilus]
MADTPFRRVSVSQVSQPTVIPAELSVEMQRSEVTKDDPASLRAELQWVGDEDVTISSGAEQPTMTLPLVDDVSNQTIALVPSGRFDRDETRPECWRVDKGPEEGFGYHLAAWFHEVELGDTFSREAEVWTDHRADGCLPPGRYTFEESCYVEEWEAIAKWSFELEIEKA